MLDFLLIALAGTIAVLNPGARKPYLWIGGAVSLTGLIAITGYILQKPALYYINLPLSNPMAFSTAALFAAIGIGFMLLCRGEK